jgi:hypothetical protein
MNCLREFCLVAATRRGFTDQVPGKLEIDIDLTTVQRETERVRDMLHDLTGPDRTDRNSV